MSSRGKRNKKRKKRLERRQARRRGIYDIIHSWRKGIIGREDPEALADVLERQTSE